jgi:hypothetical protein
LYRWQYSCYGLICLTLSNPIFIVDLAGAGSVRCLLVSVCLICLTLSNSIFIVYLAGAGGYMLEDAVHVHSLGTHDSGGRSQLLHLQR